MREKETPRFAIITGFSSGIGFEVMRGLAEQGWRVVGITRSPVRGRRAIEILRAQTGNPGLHFHAADLSLLKETRDVAALIASKNPKIDLLINNAGALYRQREETTEGFERTLALNHLSPFVLTQSLLPHLQGRIVNVTSGAHHGAALDLDDLGMSKGRFNGWTQYRRSKLMNILFTRELARRLPEPFTATCLHPGFVKTRFGQENGALMRWVMKLMMLSAIKPKLAAQGVLRLALDPALSEANGQYFDRGTPATPSPQAQDDDLAKRLWEKTGEMI